MNSCELFVPINHLKNLHGCVRLCVPQQYVHTEILSAIFCALTGEYKRWRETKEMKKTENSQIG